MQSITERKLLRMWVVIALTISLIASMVAFAQPAFAQPYNPAHPRLEATVTGPNVGGHIKAYVGQTFSIHGCVTNVGEEPALNVSATLAIDTGAVFVEGEPVNLDGTSTKTLGNIPAGASFPVEWTILCTAEGPSTFTITANGFDDIIQDNPATPDVDESAIVNYNTTSPPNFVVVNQVLRESLSVEFFCPDPVRQNAMLNKSEIWGPGCGPYMITAKITNNGYATVNNVKATLTWDVNAALCTGETAEKTVGDGILGQFESDYVSWWVSCVTACATVPGFTTFSVNASGISTVCGAVASPGAASFKVWQDPVQVSLHTQFGVLPTSHDNINMPEICVGKDFLLHAAIKNCVGCNLQPVTAELMNDGNGKWGLMDGQYYIPSLPMISNGQTLNVDELLSAQYQKGWHLTVLQPGNITLTVKVTAIDCTNCTYTRYASVSFKAVNSPQIGVTLDPVECWKMEGDSFIVTGTVTNLGDSTLNNVKVLLLNNKDADIDLPNPVCVVPSLAVGASAPVSWDVTCTGSHEIAFAGQVAHITVNDGGFYDGLTPTVVISTPPSGTQATAQAVMFMGKVVAVNILNPGSGYTQPPTVSFSLPGQWVSAKATATIWDPSTPACGASFKAVASGESACRNISSDSNLITVNQMDLDLDVVAYSCGDGPSTPNGNGTLVIKTGETFSVDAIITNAGECPCTVDNVKATIYLLNDTGASSYSVNDPLSDKASLVCEESATKVVGSVPHAILEGMKAQWTAQCTREGDVIAFVDVEVTIDGCTLHVYDWYEIQQIPGGLTYCVDLGKDWNYFSVPIFPDDNNINAVLHDIAGQYTQVWSYQDGKWYLYDPYHPLDAVGDPYYDILEQFYGIGKLTEINPGAGYIIRMIYADTFCGQGYELGSVPNQVPPTYPLNKGWNLIGFKTMDLNKDSQITQAYDAMRVAYYLKSMDTPPNYGGIIIGEEAIFLRYYEPGIGWDELGNNDSMLIGKGYWLYASQSGLYISPPIKAEAP